MPTMKVETLKRRLGKPAGQIRWPLGMAGPAGSGPTGTTCGDCNSRIPAGQCLVQRTKTKRWGPPTKTDNASCHFFEPRRG
jgi:hypothetical protein